MMQCCYLMMAGGTGGHVFPALAVAKELINRGAKVYWLGTQSGMESIIVPVEDIAIKTIDVKGFRGKGWLAKLVVPFLLCKAILQSIQIIRSINPSVVVGFGGFVSAPGGIAAKLLGKKLVIHEQNSVVGLSNKLLAKFAHQKLVAFPYSLDNAIHIGNPVRSAFAQVKRNYRSDHRLRVLIIGGSLGAKAINDLMPSVFESIDGNLRPEIWHQTGKDKIEPVQMAYRQKKVEARVQEFIDDMLEAYEWADLLICRAGALTVSEVAVVGLPAIFVPLPSAVDNHQYYNAQWLTDNEAALMIEQKNLTEEKLSQQIMKFISQRENLEIMGKKAKRLALPDAAYKAANYCEALCCEELCNAH
ncbi:undecaprenyldiphospho-muramoylpentapeptide beta-N-acetylglucosaminyltransferase [Candidatus Endobugula sertula]|uniref:UDP-N-acetylglucosamine--N-acetylmuramyl-(pentapeptide) pyrophosphoryl-undecaprenol N-acetylglucosamine transferase n=1 Tax=Candidatus Endobugula sertula TaxID=62101 RepID=A0A1D2QTM1_9GAMM|nr:undecaprenyldiphospho-muramoylpentapeptide beta-N-acetylglucosaminyltransferase [Candidatus Endobugula sertula]